MTREVGQALCALLVSTFLAGAASAASIGTPSPGTPFCVPGVDGVMSCVCANPPGPGQGCGNTAGLGATLSSFGSASLLADSTDPGSLTLVGTDMHQGLTCVFLQSRIQVSSGLPFGAGIRCVHGELLIRLYVKAMVNGVAVAPGPGDPSISNRAAANTPSDVIPAGATRYYQVFYRDPPFQTINPGPPCPAFAPFNITGGQKITWTP
jgi:hypothetical protein